MKVLALLFISFFASISKAFMFDFGQHAQQQQQQQQQQPQISYEDSVLNNDCDKYLCPDTMACVSSAEKCPCPFPKSQLRCVLPNGHHICISKPATHDIALQELYDDPVKGPKTRTKGSRDCGWVEQAFKGEM
ncbi:LAMI_0H16270g1_1 [Lachancea mirantina]|uniref:Long chronological lifespan protein 2 n=1 Tax=Lachancea mirantina TaxID=1230905 RepID=A0A1G4KJ59_9SACH|nr:LAMI_0H16270g1_1 [Lachancea mirantina]